MLRFIIKMVVFALCCVSYETSAQCTMSEPTKVNTTGISYSARRFPGPSSDSIAVFRQGLQPRLMVKYPYGAAVYSLVNPTVPSITLPDGRIDYDHFAPAGDGSSITTKVAASLDGQRLAVHMLYSAKDYWDLTRQPTVQILIPDSVSTTKYNQAGQTGLAAGPNSPDLVIDKTIDNKYILYHVNGNSITVGDITGASLFNPQLPFISKNIYSGYSDTVFNVNIASSGMRKYLIWSENTKIYALDITRPYGSTNGLGDGLGTPIILTKQDLGIGTSENFSNSSVASLNGNIYVFVKTYNGGNSNAIVGFYLFRLDIVAKQFIPVPISPGGSLKATPFPGMTYMPSVSFYNTATDLIFMSLDRIGNKFKLSSYTVNTWPTNHSVSFNTFAEAVGSSYDFKILQLNSTGNAVGYIGTVIDTYVGAITCTIQ